MTNHKGKGQHKGKDSKSNANSSSANTSKTTKKEMKFTPLDPRSYGAQVGYSTVLDAIITEIKTTFDKSGMDVQECLEAESKLVFPMPRLMKSKNPDADERAIENEEFLHDWRDDKKRYKNRMEELKRGLDKAYGLIWNKYVSAAMKRRIEEHPNYYLEIKDDVIELLKAIKASMHESVRAQKALITADAALIKFDLFRQNDLSLGDYIKQFKELRDVYKTQCGRRTWDGFLENQPE